jgi:pimeloyl-ACP methyl ester carboxylesterase
MASLQANGMTLEYEVHGVGTPLLMIMGLGGQLTSWPPGLVEEFVARGFQVITFDNRDSGLSTKGTVAPAPMSRQILATLFRRFANSEYKLADMANDAAGLLDGLGIDSAHVVGMSMGGMIAQSLALAHPGKVRSLTSVMSTTGNKRVGHIGFRVMPKLAKLTTGDELDHVDRSVSIFRIISGSSFDEAEARAMAERDRARSYCPDGTARQTAAIMASPDRTQQLKKLRVPTLVIHGLEDVLVVPSGGIATAKAVARARLLMFPDMGHNLPKQRHAEMADAVLENSQRTSLRTEIANR